jgi:hypothetical protein
MSQKAGRLIGVEIFLALYRRHDEISKSKTSSLKLLLDFDVGKAGQPSSSCFKLRLVVAAMRRSLILQVATVNDKPFKQSFYLKTETAVLSSSAP